MIITHGYAAQSARSVLKPYTFKRREPIDLLIEQRRSLAGSVIGSIAQTQEMLNFCAQNDITADVEVVSPKAINEAFKRVIAKDVQYRFVLDMSQI